MDKGQEAKSYFEQGLNCAQAVALAFEKELGLDAESIKRLSVGFGGGFGRQGLVCGAVCAMTMVIGFVHGQNKDKLGVYEVLKQACKDVQTQIGSIICKEIKGCFKTGCGEVCSIVANVTQKYIENK